ncbi:MAG: hypothetical protein ACFFC7_15815 [Candidatus Hermodarchaeota archaeon]
MKKSILLIIMIGVIFLPSVRVTAEDYYESVDLPSDHYYLIKLSTTQDTYFNYSIMIKLIADNPYMDFLMFNQSQYNIYKSDFISGVNSETWNPVLQILNKAGAIGGSYLYVNDPLYIVVEHANFTTGGAPAGDMMKLTVELEYLEVVTIEDGVIIPEIPSTTSNGVVDNPGFEVIGIFLAFATLLVASVVYRHRRNK